MSDFTQEALDRADYWARIAWAQLLPHHLPRTSYREAIRIPPHTTERKLVERPRYLYATCRAVSEAWTVLWAR